MLPYLSHIVPIERYNDLREQAKVEINGLVRFHQPQEDVDTIRAMNNKYGDSGGQLYHDNCFHVQNQTPRMDTDYNDNPIEKFEAKLEEILPNSRKELFVNWNTINRDVGDYKAFIRVKLNNNILKEEVVKLSSNHNNLNTKLSTIEESVSDNSNFVYKYLYT